MNIRRFFGCCCCAQTPEVEQEVPAEREAPVIVQVNSSSEIPLTCWTRFKNAVTGFFRRIRALFSTANPETCHQVPKNIRDNSTLSKKQITKIEKYNPPRHLLSREGHPIAGVYRDYCVLHALNPKDIVTVQTFFSAFDETQAINDANQLPAPKNAFFHSTYVQGKDEVMMDKEGECVICNDPKVDGQIVDLKDPRLTVSAAALPNGAINAYMSLNDRTPLPKVDNIHRLSWTLLDVLKMDANIHLNREQSYLDNPLAGAVPCLVELPKDATLVTKREPTSRR